MRVILGVLIVPKMRHIFYVEYLNMYGLSVKSRGVGTAKRPEVPKLNRNVVRSTLEIYIVK